MWLYMMFVGRYTIQIQLLIFVSGDVKGNCGL